MHITRFRTAGRFVTAAILAIAGRQAFAAQSQQHTTQALYQKDTDLVTTGMGMGIHVPGI